jgi:T5SS/PEP-CTERM-associated repeat protein
LRCSKGDFGCCGQVSISPALRHETSRREIALLPGPAIDQKRIVTLRWIISLLALALFTMVDKTWGAASASGDFKVEMPNPDVDFWIFSYNSPLTGTGSVSLFNGSDMTGDLNMGTLPGAQTATVSGTDSIWNMNSLHVGSDGRGQLTIQSGAEVSVTITGVTEVGNGTILISSGTLTSGEGRIGSVKGKNGTITVSGGSGEWNTETIYVGFAGTGTLDVTAGGSVSGSRLTIATATGSSGDVTVNGGSTIDLRGSLFVGDKGRGTLDIVGGARVSNSFGDIGGGVNAVGSATVDGSGSTWTNRSFLEVGTEGFGTLIVSDEGVVTNASFADLGYFSGSRGVITITDEGSKWMNAGDLYVATDGEGTLNILDGGFVSNKYAQLAVNSGANATVNVAGTGSRWNCTSDLEIGSGGTGMLAISLGGVVSGTRAYVGTYAGANGTVLVIRRGLSME